MIGAIVCGAILLAFIAGSVLLWERAMDSGQPLSILGVLAFHFTGTTVVVLACGFASA